MTVQAFVEAVSLHPLYRAVLGFFAVYPVFGVIVRVTTAFEFFRRRERDRSTDPPDVERMPMVSVLIPAYCDAASIGDTLEAAIRIDYPYYEVVVVDDASTDGTRAVVQPHVSRGQVRLIAKARNEGRAMALNDGLPCLRGEIVLVLGADAEPDPLILRWMVPHFASARVAGVTGNPRVANRETFLAQLQVLEFSSIVSLLRRAQRIWGRVLTVSGMVGAFRKSALLDVGLYRPGMATEDIELVWRLQRASYDVRYEPRAIVWMRVPATLRALVAQRSGWARGLAQVLRRHRDVVRRWRTRRMWPVFWEAALSILWAYCFVALTAFWVASYLCGVAPAGVSPIPNWWIMTIGTLAVAQLLAGVILDARYDPTVRRHYPLAVVQPIAWWVLMSLITAVATPAGLFGWTRRGSATR